MLQPVVRRTWAPRGQTPVQYSWDRHDRITAVAAISVAPVRRRMGLYFRLLDHNLKTPDAVAFVRDLRKELQAPILLVWDLLNVHRAAAKELLRRAPRWLAIAWLPPYAPDVNPVEHIWNQSKYTDLANYVPDDIAALGRRVRGSLRAQRSSPDLLRSFFRAAKLPL